MNSKEAIKATADVSLTVVNMYVSDLTDEELLQRPAPGCNHLAWQLGHLISAEVSLLESICPGKAATLPPGFAEKHSKEKNGVDDPKEFFTKQEYSDLFAKVREATVAALESVSDTDLNAPSPEHMRTHFPTVAHMFVLIATHPMMHAGQFAVARRQLGKPVLI